MNDQREQQCEGLLPYIAGEGTADERERYELHLSSCSSCRHDYQELTTIWNSLPYLVEPVEPPKELKRQVMESIFGREKTAIRIERPVPTGRRRAQWIGGLVAALVAGLLLGFWWRGEEDLAPIAGTSVAAEEPVLVMTQLKLEAADSQAEGAIGDATLTRQGAQYAMMIQAKGLPVTHEQEAYQVWLIKDGKRRSAGTFCVDGQGNGVLHYEAGKEPPAFDSIGITLEPDAKGNAPRGKKMLGTT